MQRDFGGVWLLGWMEYSSKGGVQGSKVDGVGLRFWWKKD